jgi:hypothetical protein
MAVCLSSTIAGIVTLASLTFPLFAYMLVSWIHKSLQFRKSRTRAIAAARRVFVINSFRQQTIKKQEAADSERCYYAQPQAILRSKHAEKLAGNSECHC